ncbi:MAG: RecQ family ATP-dependent DNA helicase [Acidobacteria bacterium]|nr:RecQ family ATP-dependent DNA helicase [Acidobacteriota bacterium]
MSLEQNLEQARGLLKKYFGYDHFRPGQEEVIRKVFEKKNCVVIMPTGGGKSVCYQIPALALPGITIVISPLIALMKDQVDTLQTLGVPATFINSSIPLSQVQSRLAGLRDGEHRIIYVAPERFYSQMFLNGIRELPVALFAIDEAHCISEWGHDFRPSYLQLPKAIDALGRPPILALTATATPEVRQDIIAQLKLQDPDIFITGFDRPSLRYVVIKTPPGGRESKTAKLIEILQKVGGVAIVYCGTRRQVEEVVAQLKQAGLAAQGYHAGMSDADRKRVQEDFMEERVRTVVATNAFGMGIDKPNVRSVVHYSMPGSMEAYYQEAGRAGRDGERSFCVLLYSRGDRSLQEYFIEQSYPPRPTVEAVYNFLYDMNQVPVGKTYDQCLDVSLRAIADGLSVQTTDMGVSGALKLLEEGGYMRRLMAADNFARGRFLRDTAEILQGLGSASAESIRVVETLARLYGDEILHHDVPFRLEDIGWKAGIENTRLVAILMELKAREWLEYIPPVHGRGLMLLKKRVPAAHLKINFLKAKERQLRELEKINKMENYAFTSECRRAFILKYFGDHSADSSCGRCDNCKGAGAREPDAYEALAKLVLYGVKEMRGRFGAVLVSDALRGRVNKKTQQFRLDRLACFGKLRNWNDAAVRETIDRLIGDGYLAKSSGLYPTAEITTLGRRWLGSAELSHLQVPLPPKPSSAPGELAAPKVESGLTEAPPNPELFDTLCALRRGFAERLKLPPFVICHDRVLKQMVLSLPRTREEMLRLSGMGEILYERYGDTFRQAIVAYCQNNPSIIATPAPATAPSRRPPKLPGLTHRETLKLYQEGLDPAALAARRGLTEGTVISHLAELIEAGTDVDIRALVSEDHERRIQTAIAEAGADLLSAIRDQTGDDISYGEIRLVAAKHRRQTVKTE